MESKQYQKTTHGVHAHICHVYRPRVGPVRFMQMSLLSFHFYHFQPRQIHIVYHNAKQVNPMFLSVRWKKYLI